MKKLPHRSLAAAFPWMPWADVALKSFEIATAASQVVPIRLARLAAAGTNPSAKDRREFHRMGAEKVVAISKSGQALALGMAPWATRIALQTFESGVAFWASCWRMATPAATLGWNPWMPRGGSASLRRPSSRATARMIGAALKPVHTTVTANARRLSGLGRT